MDYWSIKGNKLVWQVKEGQPHEDHLEMSGEKASVIVHYGTDAEGRLTLNHNIVYPMLRTHPNDTHASSYVNYDLFGEFLMDGKQIVEYPARFEFDGVLSVVSSCGNIEITRHIYPSFNDAIVWNRLVFYNSGVDTVHISSVGFENITYGRGVKGVYNFTAKLPAFDIKLSSGNSFSISICYSGIINTEAPPQTNALNDLSKRKDFLNKRRQSLVLKTNDRVLDTAFAFAKIRTCESIFKTNCGYLHSPGGGTYYAAIWTNDQLEYASPFFPFAGDNRAISATVNAYRLFLPFMGDDYHPIPSSIISEGLDFWEGAGDRGDASMYLYGLSRFLLGNGDAMLAESFFPAIDWCVTYITKKINTDGVIESDSDELEGRFETGTANLCTSCLAYGGLITSASLARELGREDRAKAYEKLAVKLRSNIESYFGGDVEGFDTYRYYKGNEVLRAWIAVPLTVGINNRREGTIAALMSKRLWSEDGLSTEAGRETFWDRSTLYALRGIFMAGEAEVAYTALKEYTCKRLLGDHIPYSVEAYPEGNQRHLAAESSLYGRIVIEGLLGLTPTGFKSFTLSPSLPAELPYIELKAIHAFSNHFDLLVKKADDMYHVEITQLDGTRQSAAIKHGEQAEFHLLN